MAAAAASAVIITKMREANQPNALDQAKLFEGEMEKLNPPRDSFPDLPDLLSYFSYSFSISVISIYYLIILPSTSAMFYQSLIR